MELRQKVYEDEKMAAQKYSLLIFTTVRNLTFVSKAYQMSVQGYFVKPSPFLNSNNDGKYRNLLATPLPPKFQRVEE